MTWLSRSFERQWGQLLGVLGYRPVDDFSSFRDAEGRSCPPFLRIVPFGPNTRAPDSVVEDGDVSVYVYPRRDERDNLNELKQRGWHAEICYWDQDGRAGEAGPWGSFLKERLFETSPHTDYVQDFAHMFHIFRLRGVGPDEPRIRALVQDIKNWIRVFDRFRFPADGDQATGMHKYMDPADFGSVGELEAIARKLISRGPDVIPDIAPVTCAQWTFQILCLAINVPLNPTAMQRLGVEADFEANWQGRIRPIASELDGIGKLPFIPWSPVEVVQAYLDSYLPRTDAVEFLTTPSDGRKVIANLLRLDPQMALGIRGYLERLKETKDPREPLVLPGVGRIRFMMPSSFYCEARKGADGMGNPWFQYVATLVDEKYVVEA